MRTGVKCSTSSHSEPPHRYHNLLYIPCGSGYSASSGTSASSSTNLTPVEYIIYPIGLRKGQVRKLEDDYQKFIHIYQEIIIRLEKLETLLSDAERIVDFTRISQVQDELRSVRTQLDDLLNLGQELVSKSEKYSKLVAPDIENITRKFEDLQRRIRTIQETQEKRSKEQHHYQQQQQQQQQFTTTSTTANTIQDDHRDDTRREYYSERKYNRVQRESRHRSPSESSDISTAHGVIDEEFKKKYLRCLAYMKLIERLYENQQESDEDSETMHRRLSRRDRTFRDRPEYEEIEKIIRETEERAYVIEKTDVDQANRIREKIRRLRDCLENLKYRSTQYQNNNDEQIVRYNERYEEHVKTTDRTVPKEREFDSDFIYDIDDTRSVISEPAPQFNAKYRKTIHSLERYKTDEQSRCVPTVEEYHLQPLLRVRSLKAIDHRTLSAPSSPVLPPRYRSHERANVQYKKQSMNQQGYQDNYQSSISKSASLPNGGFPVQVPIVPAHIPQQPVMYRERVIDRHVAERSTSRADSHRQQQQQESASMQARSSTISGQSQTLNRAIPIRYEASNVVVNGSSGGGGGGGSHSASSSYRQTNGHRQEQYPPYFYNEQYPGAGGAGGSYRQQAYATQHIGPHPTRIVN
ncbi:unnamed protein product [Adineta steineri]|uniref:Uncharacterized protein n=1 Tax=Adineta steineri TaxID=433720 RepID=A0A815HXF2_9BILA|nr:unnamed protein product [Adineta steineri]CAF3530667.1 unnamed protein product [Adineta steineri]